MFWPASLDTLASAAPVGGPLTSLHHYLEILHLYTRKYTHCWRPNASGFGIKGAILCVKWPILHVTFPDPSVLCDIVIDPRNRTSSFPGGWLTPHGHICAGIRVLFSANFASQRSLIYFTTHFITHCCYYFIQLNNSSFLFNSTIHPVMLAIFLSIMAFKWPANGKSRSGRVVLMHVLMYTWRNSEICPLGE